MEHYPDYYSDYTDPKLTDYPSSTDGIGYIPTCEELNLAFRQLADAKTWPSDVIKHKVIIIISPWNQYKEQCLYEEWLVDKSVSSKEKFLGELTFYKIDGRWHYNGFVKNS